MATEAVEVGTVNLTGAMECAQTGVGTAHGEILIVSGRDGTAEGGGSGGTGGSPRGGGIGALGATAWIQIGLITVLVGVLAALGYVSIRRR